VAKKNMLGGDFNDVLDGVNSDFEKESEFGVQMGTCARTVYRPICFEMWAKHRDVHGENTA
jgi:hypothetical protein